MKLTLADAQKGILEVTEFSQKLGDVLNFLLKEVQDVRVYCGQENDARKAEIEAKTKEVEKRLDEETKRLKEVLKRENEERQREMRDLEAFTKKENAERKRETEDINEALRTENEKRIKEAEALKEKMERENKEMQAYLEKDAKEMKAKMEAESKALQEKLDKEASALKNKLTEGEESRKKETKALQEKMEKEKEALAKQMESGSKELSEKMAREEEQRRKEAQEMKDRLETDKKQQGNAFTEMFDRLKMENESRKMEVHGLKDILVRENDLRIRDTEELRMAMELSSQKMGEALERECFDMDQKLKNIGEELNDLVKTEKKDILAKLETQGSELKRKIEMETNEIRDKMQVDKKVLSSKLDEDNEDRRKEVALLKAHMQKEREEMRGQLESDTKMVLDQLEKDSSDIMNLLKKERTERERDSNLIKERIDNEKKELQISIDKDRDNLMKRLTEEHNMRRLEQKELVQRLDNNENTGKADIQELFSKLKREQEAREGELDEVRNTVKQDKNQIEEKLIKEKQMLRESLTTESLEVNKRVDKVNLDRMNDVADIQSKMSLIGKSASRHLDNLRQSLYRDCQNLFELATKPCSVVFNAFREDSYMDGGEDYLTFSGCTVNIGNAMNHKSGEFKVPEAGLYLFLVTCCTFDMKKCLLSIRKNGKDVANIFDQDGMENRGRTMIGQNVLLELVEGDKVQVYINTSSGLFDHKNSHYTQFIGAMLRPSVDTLAAAMRRLGNTDDEEDHGEESMRSTRTGLNGGDASMAAGRRNQRGGSRNRLLSPQPQGGPGASGTGYSKREASSEPHVVNGHLSPAPASLHSLAISNDESTVSTPPTVNNLQVTGTALTKLDEEVAVQEPMNGNTENHPEEKAPELGTGEPEQPEEAKPNIDKPQQSYLALTKLGMGKKSVAKPVDVNKPTTAAKGGKKSITEMASSTLFKAGFTKS